MPSIERAIFQKGSTTYYWSSQFFPKGVREDVFKLYSFVRTIDDYVDGTPARPQLFYAVHSLWTEAAADPDFSVTGAPADDLNQRVVKNMLHLVRTYNIDTRWVEAFFDAMEMDITGRRYETIDEVLTYVYGSAEVIGLMMARIMGLPQAASSAARLQGRAMQWINFIRDIREDLELGRCYIPRSDLDAFGLRDLSEKEIRTHESAFAELLRYEIDRYATWQHEATQGFSHIPPRLRRPLKTAVAMYDWTASEIARQPLIVLERKVKPSRWRVLRAACLQLA